jgi:hypothetical protein
MLESEAAKTYIKKFTLEKYFDVQIQELSSTKTFSDLRNVFKI